MNNYAKMIDGRLKYAPTAIRTDEGLVCNPRPDKLIPLGYIEPTKGLFATRGRTN